MAPIIRTGSQAIILEQKEDCKLSRIRKSHSVDFKVQVALDAIREDATIVVILMWHSCNGGSPLEERGDSRNVIRLFR